MVLKLENLHKTFIRREGRRRQKVHAVHSVSLTIPGQGVAGLVGESGCGKTTLSRIIVGLEKPEHGTVAFRGRTINYQNRDDIRYLRRGIQIVFQDPNTTFNPRRTLLSSLQEGLINRDMVREERLERIRSLVDIIGISYDSLDKYPHQFSGGQKQRLAIARALLLEPELLILDEPVSSLDVSVQAQIINLLMDIRKEFGLTYLLISHDLHLVGYVSTMIAVMREGKIVEHGDADQVLSHPVHPYTRELFASSPIIH